MCSAVSDPAAALMSDRLPPSTGLRIPFRLIFTVVTFFLIAAAVFRLLFVGVLQLSPFSFWLDYPDHAVSSAFYYLPQEGSCLLLEDHF
ncbi:hypothetical protein CIB84_010588 [Bambusicola thoracicus]|uniref:Uncharacterized protein n=1 Tax=Bambusicola thoracicus TaxID=9083 RepID=A0A2P4SNF9_BAMTH|nr:hypothetical protein CIB84_010588 [Bambusicola thoracicus]